MNVHGKQSWYLVLCNPVKQGWIVLPIDELIRFGVVPRGWFLSHVTHTFFEPIRGQNIQIESAA